MRRAAAACLALAQVALGGCTQSASNSDAGDASSDGALMSCDPHGGEFQLSSVRDDAGVGEAICEGAGVQSTLRVERADGGDRATLVATGADTFTCEGLLTGCQFDGTCTFGMAPDQTALTLTLRFSTGGLEGQAQLLRVGSHPCTARYRLAGTRR